MKRAARIVVALGAALLLLASALGGVAGAWLFAAAAPLVPGGLIVHAAPRRGNRRGALAVALGLVVALETGSLGLLAIRGAAMGPEHGSGLPPATILMLVALGLVPLLLVPLGYALSFGPRRPSSSEGRRAVADLDAPRP
jgi:hypothetical protein